MKGNLCWALIVGLNLFHYSRVAVRVNLYEDRVIYAMKECQRGKKAGIEKKVGAFKKSRGNSTHESAIGKNDNIYRTEKNVSNGTTVCVYRAIDCWVKKMPSY